MASKIIKLGNNVTTYLPVTIANAVQYSPEPGTYVSVQDAIDSVSERINQVNTTFAGDLSSYVSKNELNNAGYLQAHQDLSSYITYIVYDDQKIKFKNNDTVLGEIDATDFIKDGMVETAYVQGNNLVISFNTDSGKSAVDVPIVDIFNASNYYTKTEIDNAAYLQANALDAYYTKTEINNAGYLTSHQSIKTINNETLVGSGNIDINGATVIYTGDDFDDASVQNGDSINSVVDSLLTYLHNDYLNKSQAEKEYVHVSGEETVTGSWQVYSTQDANAAQWLDYRFEQLDLESANGLKDEIINLITNGGTTNVYTITFNNFRELNTISNELNEEYQASFEISDNAVIHRSLTETLKDYVRKNELTSYATTAYVEQYYYDKNAIDTVLGNYVATGNIQQLGLVRQTDLDAELSSYVTTNDLDSKLSSYVTTNDLDSKLSSYVTNDSLNNYYTKSDAADAMDTAIEEKFSIGNYTGGFTITPGAHTLTGDELRSKLTQYYSIWNMDQTNIDLVNELVSHLNTNYTTGEYTISKAMYTALEAVSGELEIDEKGSIEPASDGVVTKVLTTDNVDVEITGIQYSVSSAPVNDFVLNIGGTFSQPANATEINIK